MSRPKGSRTTPKQAGQAGQAGFTIIELLIATLIFSMLLVLVTASVLQFTRQYYKGLISSNTQNTARAIIDDITRAIQYNPGGVYKLTSVDHTTSTDPNADPFGYCIGETKRYSFALNARIVDEPITTEGLHSAHALISDGVSGCSTAAAALDVKNPTVMTSNDPVTGSALRNQRELLGQNMRLSKFVIKESSSLSNAYDITVRIIYGDNDLLCTPSVEGSCNNQNGETDQLMNPAVLECKSGIGTEFCAVSEFKTTVKKRID